MIHSGGPRPIDIEVSPDGTRAAVVDHRQVVTLYDLAGRRAVATRSSADVAYGSPAFSPDGERLAVSVFPMSCFRGVGCDESAIEVFDSSDLLPLHVRYVGGLDAPARDLRFSPSGELLAAVPPFYYSQPTNNIAIWDVDEPDEPRMWLSLDEPGPDRRVSPDTAPPGWLEFSPDSSRIYAGGAGPTAAFDLRTGAPIRQFDGDGPLALSPDGQTVAMLTTSTSVALIDTLDGRRRAELIGHDALVTAAAFSPDGRRVATVSNDETVAVWNATTGERQHLLTGHVGSVYDAAYSPDGATLYTAGADGSIMVWDTDGAGGVARRLRGSTLPVGNTFNVSLDTDSAVLVGASGLLAIDLDGGEPIPMESGQGIEAAWGAHDPAGHRFVVVSWDGRLHLWDTGSGELLATSEGRGVENLGAVAFSADGETLLVGDADGTVTERDSLTLEPTGRSVHVGVEPLAVRTAPDGLIAVLAPSSDPGDGSITSEIVFADIDDGGVLRRVHAAYSMPRTNFSPDGAAFALGGFDGRLGIIDVASGEIVGPEDPVHAGGIAWVAFSPDGTQLATLGFDGEVALVDRATGVARARARPGPANLQAAVTFHSDGNAVLVAYEDGSVVQLATDPADWIEHACRVAGRNLTEAEWRDAFGDRPHHDTCSTTH